MKLETEFRLYLQRQQLESLLQDLLVPAESKLAPTQWVRLASPLDAICSDEAMLLCQSSDTQWLVWIPDHGEVVLDRNQFLPLDQDDRY
jgi:hypothetical protein